jgi:methylmalonyl-CoA mutase C-terminal domain/subunit
MHRRWAGAGEEMQRKIRVLVGKPGLDGHDRGAKVVAAALRDAGMEVIYTGLHQTPEQVVEAAVQEDVDVVALSILSGAHMTLFPEVHALMKRNGIGDRLLTGGGIIPSEDMDTLSKLGVGRLFGPGSSTQDIAAYIREWFGAARNGGAPAARAATSVPARGAAKRAAQSRPRKPAARKPAKKAAPKKSAARGRAAPARKSAAKTKSAPRRKPAQRKPARAAKRPARSGRR